MQRRGGITGFLNNVNKNCICRVLRLLRVFPVFHVLLISPVSFVLLVSLVLLDWLNIWKTVNHWLTDLLTAWNQEMLRASKKAFYCSLNTFSSPYFGRLPKAPYPSTRVWHLVSRLLGIETFLNFLRVSVSVSKIFSQKKSLGIGLKNI